jgi:hypothetical protein
MKPRKLNIEPIIIDKAGKTTKKIIGVILPTGSPGISYHLLSFQIY